MGKPNIILISIEGLNFEKMNCGQPMESGGGFARLCAESLRFTHFFAPSSLSQPTIASLFTGLTPAEHRLLDNGSTSLSEATFTLAEKALGVGYNTGFFSGGAPVLCKSGLQQGFEVCDDEFLSAESSFRPVGVNFERAQSWITEQENPFLIHLYAADTQFYNVPTFTIEGKERARTFESQVDEIDESLGIFIQWLEKKKLWQNSIVIVMGLNGESLIQRPITWRENVFGENVHVPLFVRLPQRDKVKDRSIDAILSHTHVGKFLLGLIDTSASKESFALYLDGWLSSLPRFIEVRSDWSTWWFGAPSVVSLRTEDYLVFPKRKMTIYQSIADQAELTPLSESQVGGQELNWLSYRIDQSFDSSPQIENEMYLFLREVDNQRPDTTKNIVERVIKKNQTPPQKMGKKKAEVFVRNTIVDTIEADILVEQGRWEELKAHPSAVVSFVAQKNLSHTGVATLHTACEKLFYSRSSLTLLRSCNDSLLLSLMAWESHLQDSDALYWEKRFVRKYRFYRQYKHLAYRNLFIDLNWHVDSGRLMGPSLADLYLHLPGKERLRKRLSAYSLPEGINFLYQ